MNTNYNIPQSKLTPRQISAFNKLNPYSFLEKDYSLTPSSNITYRELFSRYYHNDDGSLGPLKKSDLLLVKPVVTQKLRLDRTYMIIIGNARKGLGEHVQITVAQSYFP